MTFSHLIQKRGDIIIGIAILAILGVMILPVPPFLLDILLSLSISLAIVILITSVYIRKPLDFSVFPSILLITTIFRLYLNVASTRLVLLRGNEGIDAAGEVIKSFGNFVVGGNYAVGEESYRRSLAIKEKVLGRNNADVALTLSNLGVLCKSQGRLAEAEALCRRALRIFRYTFGPRHPKVAVCRVIHEEIRAAMRG